MTIENRLSVTPKDIRRIVLVCRKCGATIGYEPRQWKYVPTKCSNCPAGEMHPASSALAHLNALRDTLVKLIESENDFFEVRFELDNSGG
jgi:hypothetical protein